jgi:hypothetical protein
MIGTLMCAGCGSTAATPAAPGAVVVTPPPSSSTITTVGHVVATNGGQPLPGLAVDLAGNGATVTDAAGIFRYSTTGGSAARLTLNGGSILPRSVVLALNATRDVAIDAVALTGAFDAAFYREFVRNAIEAPEDVQALRRWTHTPSIHLKTVDEAGEAIDAATLDLIEATAKEAVPQWTSGKLGVPVVERGGTTREGQSGWITLKFPAAAATDSCGRAQIAVDGGWIEFSYHVAASASINCRASAAFVAPRVVRHELGHALGFFHTGSQNDVMWGGSWPDGNLTPSARELTAAAIAYSRPVGNVDPDSDPNGTVVLAPMIVRDRPHLP